MSNVVWPVTRGLSWSVFKTPNFSTIIKTGASGKEVRAALWASPIWEFKLTYEVLLDDPGRIDPNLSYTDLQTILGFFLSRQGSFDSFLYQDPNDYQVNGQILTPDAGSILRYQCVRSLGGFTEAIQAVGGILAINVNGVAQNVATTGFLDTAGGFNFFLPPAGVVSADFTFYYRVRFGALGSGGGGGSGTGSDSLEFENFMNLLWSLQEVDLVSVKV